MNFTIKTIGCKVNTYESNKIKADMINAGFSFIDATTDFDFKYIDFYIINTCSVTNVADKKSRQMIHRAKKLNEHIKVVATGCYIDSHIDNLDNEIDLYVKNADKKNLVDILCTRYENDIKKINDKVENNIDSIRSFIKIQDGCNQYCTYCIIPYLRGSIVSRDDNEIINEIQKKVDGGVREIVLTGIHLSSFGIDRENKNYDNDGAIDIGRKALLDLIYKIASIKGNLERLRLGSLEPRIIDTDFILALIGENETYKKIYGDDICKVVKNIFCENFCLSLQSGCDKTLKNMNRHYTTRDFENACGIIRKYMENATITTDIIVGFPGETYEDFMESLSFVKKMRFLNPNIFPYSRRKGTKADTFEDQRTNAEKHERAVLMINECDKISREIEKEHLAKYKNDKEILDAMLVEEVVVKDKKRYAVGYLKEYIKKEICMS